MFNLVAPKRFSIGTQTKKEVSLYELLKSLVIMVIVQKCFPQVSGSLILDASFTLSVSQTV